MVAYEKDSSYRHIATYLDYLNKDNTQWLCVYIVNSKWSKS